ncbi:Rv1733c family protein [Streptomyces caniscabiei]
MTGWNTSDGTVRTGQTKVPVETPAGTRVMVWTDRRGGLTSKPVTHQEAQAQTVLVGVVAAMGAGGAVLCGAGAVRGGLDRRRMTAWDEEWAPDRYASASESSRTPASGILRPVRSAPVSTPTR